MQKKFWFTCLTLFMVIFSCSCVGIFGLTWMGVIDFQNSPRLVSGLAHTSKSTSGYPLSEEQQNYIQSNGYPASFSILFYQEENSSGGVQDVRFESWYYFSPDEAATFINGKLSKEDHSSLSGGSTSWSYKSEMFRAYMTREQVAQSANLDEWLIIPVENSLVPNAQVYYADWLTFGFQDGKLIFVETFAGE